MNYRVFILISIFISILLTILTIISENKKEKIFYEKRKQRKDNLEIKIKNLDNPEANEISSKEKYKEYLKSDHWQEIRKKALERANNKCQLCSSKIKLNVHHNTYKNKGHEDLSDLVVLCRECHAKFHDKLA